MEISETSLGLARAMRDVQVGYLVFVVPKRTSLLSCAGKADSPVSTRANILDVVMILVPPTL